MRLTSLSVKHVRTHSEYILPLAPQVTLITGDNGSGKTSLLESIYIALQGSSFKGSDSEILKFNTPWYRIETVADDDSRRVVKFDPSRSSGKKQFEIGSKTQYRLTHANKYPVVLFEPDDLRLIGGSPSRRREFIDRLLSQIDPEYALSLRRYERALKQRNSLLKKTHQQNNLFVWDVSLSKYGAYIVERRHGLVGQLRPRLATIYKEIAKNDDIVSIDYSNIYRQSVEQKLLSDLHQSIHRDIALGYTSVGPHRHDILFDLNSHPAMSAASRGEVRTIVIALKFLEVDLLKDMTKKDPIILLDDVFSELDESRQSALINHFSSYQTIITSVSSPLTDYPTIQLSN